MEVKQVKYLYTLKIDVGGVIIDPFNVFKYNLHERRHSIALLERVFISFVSRFVHCPS
jgi:hypothetical protein